MRKKSLVYKILLPVAAVFLVVIALLLSLTMRVWVGGAKQENPFFLPGDAQFLWEPGESWSLGFARQNLTGNPEVRANIEKGKYVLPGFNDITTTYRSTGIMDDLFAKAVFLDDNTGRGGILYAVVDCLVL